MTISRMLSLIAATAALLLLTGCGSMGLGGAGVEVRSDFNEGRLFTYMRVPFTRDLNNTPAPELKGGRKRIITITLPRANVSAEFSSNALADIAKEQGLTKLYFADLEIFDVLGIFSTRKLILYGE